MCYLCCVLFEIDNGMVKRTFVEHSVIQAVVVLSLITAVGLVLGKVKILGISLGVTFVFSSEYWADISGLL